MFDVAATGLPVLSILPFMVAQHLSRLSETCASCPFLWHILGHLLVSPATGLPVLLTLAPFVSPFVNDPPFSSISATNYGLTSLRNVTQLRSSLRVVGREQISPGTTVSSHPFLFGLHPFIAFFAIKDIDPDSRLFPFPLPATLCVSSCHSQDRPCLHRRLVLSETGHHRHSIQLGVVVARTSQRVSPSLFISSTITRA